MRLLFALVLVIAQSADEANRLFQAQEWMKASAAFEGVLKANPTDAQSWFRLGVSRHALGDYRGAATAFQKARENNFPAPIQLPLRFAKTYARLGEKEKALEELKRAVDNGYSQPDLLNGDNDLLSLRADQRYDEAVAVAGRNQRPCALAKEYRQFDYWLGEWDVEIGGQRAGRSSIQLILDDCVVFENFWIVNGSYSGKSFSIWNATEKRWEQQYVDTTGASRFWIGSLEGDQLVFVPRGSGPTPGTIRRMSYIKEGPDRVQQLIEISTDNGKTWSNGFDGLYLRRK